MHATVADTAGAATRNRKSHIFNRNRVHLGGFCEGVYLRRERLTHRYTRGLLFLNSLIQRIKEPARLLLKINWFIESHDSAHERDRLKGRSGRREEGRIPRAFKSLIRAAATRRSRHWDRVPWWRHPRYRVKEECHVGIWKKPSRFRKSANFLKFLVISLRIFRKISIGIDHK